MEERDIIQNLPWYPDYITILDDSKMAKEDLDLKNDPERQLNKIKGFYQRIGADYSKNDWIKESEINFQIDSDSLNKLKKVIKFASILEKVVSLQDNATIGEFLQYENDNEYKKLVGDIKFFLGVSQVKHNTDFIKKAYDQIFIKFFKDDYLTYDNAKNGSYYFIYYFKCLYELVWKYSNKSLYYNIHQQIKDCALNATLMLTNRLQYDYGYGGNDLLNKILPEIESVKKLID